MNFDKIAPQLRANELRMESFQFNAVKFGGKVKRCLIEAPVGAGKTLIGLQTALGIFTPNSRIVIVCSRNALYTWERELNKWFPGIFEKDEFCIIDGSPGERALQWANPKHRIKVTTFHKLMNDIAEAERFKNKHVVDIILVDEAHRARNRKAKTFAALKILSKPLPGKPSLPAFIELTGTPGDKGVQHMWGYFNQIAPSFFTSYWRFITTFCETVEGRYGKEIIGNKNTEGFIQTVRPYFWKVNVEDTKLQKVRRHIIPIDLSPKLRKVYDELEDQMLSITDDGEMVVAATSLDQTMKLRQFLTYPGSLFPSLGLGDLPEWIADKIEDEDSGVFRHSIIFTPFTANLKPYQEYFADRFKKTVITLQGGMDPKEQQARVEECKRVRGMAICTTKYAQSFEFPDMAAAFMAGYEWSKDDMEQAEGRIRRLVSTFIPNVYYPQFKGTIDELMFQILDGKTINLKQLFEHYKGLKRP